MLKSGATAEVTRRRRLHFQHLGDVITDARRLSVCRLTQLGNWSLGQICRHLAAGMRWSIDGPEDLSVYPWWHRLVGPLFKHYVLRFGLTPGYKLKGVPARRLVPDPTDSAEGLRELEDAISRLQVESKRIPRHVLGRFTREQWDRYHLRHAELHLSFLVPVA